MRPFTLLIKPASADCNLRCEYCFYLEKCSLYPDTARHRMSDEVLERLVKSYMATDQPGYGFGWQGGEPTLMGLDFFENAVTLQQKYGQPGAVVSNGLQTNATRITGDLASHFSKYQFLLGCSLDGPPAIHNQYRKTIDGAPTHQLVLNGLNVLKEHQVEFNILTLVSQSNVSHPEAVYRYLKDEGFQFHQYIPCVEFDKKNSLLPFAINGREWGEFLCRLFDVWYPEDCYSISIRHFDSILFKLVEDRSNVCHMGKRCNEYLVVEHNGDVYPCDFFVEKNLKLGNIMDNEWEDLLGSPLLNRFAAKKHQWNSACTACNLLDLCNGDCLKHRMYNNNSPQTLSWLCEGWQRFLSHTRERFESLAAEIRRHRFQTLNHYPSPVNSYKQTKKVGRNDPCPCGSGKKYKKCCGAQNI